MTQRIKKIVYRRPNVSLGNSTDAILPGGPLLPDFYQSRLFRINETVVETSYILWEWNGIDLTQFGDIVQITGSDSNVAVSGTGSFEVVNNITLRENPYGGASTISTPVLEPPISGSFLKFAHSGSYNGFFVPINDLDVNDYLTNGIQIEYLQMSASTGPSSINQNIAFGYVQYETDGKITGMGILRNLSNRAAYAYINKSRAFYGTTSGQTGAETSAPGLVYVTKYLSEIPSGSAISSGKFEMSQIVANANLNSWGNEMRYEIHSVANINASFYTSSFAPTKFGFWVYNDGSTNRDHSVFLQNIRLTVPWRIR